MKFQNVTIATIFIRLINHLELVIDIKYQHYQTIFRYKKAFLRFGCFCSNATVAIANLVNDLSKFIMKSYVFRIDAHNSEQVIFLKTNIAHIIMEKSKNAQL